MEKVRVRRGRAGWVLGPTLLLLICGGCPKRFDPRAEPITGSANSQAADAYHAARLALDRGDNERASTDFATFLSRYPDDPLAPQARIGRARAEIGLGQMRKAKELLEPLATQPPPPNTNPDAAQINQSRAKYLLGLVAFKTHDYRKTRELLAPFSSTIGGPDAVELHAMLGRASDELGDTKGALEEYSLFFGGARPAEKIFLRDRVSAMVTALPPGEAQRLEQALPKDALAAAYLGRRAAADLRSSGREAEAKIVLDETAGARKKAGLEEAKEARSWGMVATRRAVGCVLPLTGKGKPLGERALRGSLLGADLLAAGLPGLPVDVVVRDTGSDPARVNQAVEELNQAGVVAIIGSPDRVESAAAAQRAAALGIPYLGLAVDESRQGELNFKMVRPRANVISALVQQALKNGARRIAILAPDNAYGQQMTQAIQQALRDARAQRPSAAQVVAELKYPDGATTFIDPVKRLAAATPDTIFVPAPAAQLQLIAPQMVAGGLLKLQGILKGPTARLYATADGMNEKFIVSTGKYLNGAVLAPLFFADPADQKQASFLERYRGAFSEEPSSLDALAFDALTAIKKTIGDTDAPLRKQVAGLLGNLGEQGITGEIAFTSTGERQGAPLLFTVENDQARLLR